MLRWLLMITVFGVVILTLPDWKPPYSYGDYVVQLLGWIMMLGPGFLLLTLIFNRLLNISFRTKL